MRVLVLYGGSSDEREVSIRSGATVTEALRSKDHYVISYDPVEGLEQLDKLSQAIDVVFPVLHGAGGEDGTLQEYFEARNIPYVGANSAVSKLCFDKARFKEFIKTLNFDVAESEIVDAQNIWQHPLARKPFVLKPHKGGSSIDTFIVRDIAKVPEKAIKNAFARHSRMMLEELIEGIETTVAVLDQHALPVIEIIPPTNEEFDYNNKYNGKTQELCPPKNVPENIQKRLQELALAIHKAVNCRHLSRTDIIVTPDNRLITLETNTIPGMTSQSLVPKAAATADISMPTLVDRLVKLAA